MQLNYMLFIHNCNLGDSFLEQEHVFKKYYYLLLLFTVSYQLYVIIKCKKLDKAESNTQEEIDDQPCAGPVLARNAWLYRVCDTGDQYCKTTGILKC